MIRGVTIPHDRSDDPDFIYWRSFDRLLRKIQRRPSWILEEWEEWITARTNWSVEQNWRERDALLGSYMEARPYERRR